MQLTVIKGDDGFEVDTTFAEGYDEEALVDVFEAWAMDALDPNPSPGWGKA